MPGPGYAGQVTSAWHEVGGGRLRVGACLSLTGRFERFGRQAALGLGLWSELDAAVELVIEDDRSDVRVLEERFPGVLASCDVVLGPYSTWLTRKAGDIAAESGRLIWNHGGAGDDVQAAHPGHVVSVPAPAGRYAVPFVEHLATSAEPGSLWVAQGKGGFGRQVAAGAEAAARRHGVTAVRIGPGSALPVGGGGRWSLFSAGTFEDDLDTVRRALASPTPPELICAVAAGVQEFGREMAEPEGIFGVGQWAPGAGRTAELGPGEGEFLEAYAGLSGVRPDYPTVQAVAAAVLAVHCARVGGGTTRPALWSAAAALDTSTLFGRFKIDPVSGVQLGHDTVLVRWGHGRPVALPS